MILARILAAVIPVCEGINMLYTLSSIDTRGWGCGTKLPHNVTSLLGVMDGAASDLRPGLPWQGVDIHEPVRLLFVVETTRKRCCGSWMKIPLSVASAETDGQLAVLDPNSSRFQRFVNGSLSITAVNDRTRQRLNFARLVSRLARQPAVCADSGKEWTVS